MLPVDNGSLKIAPRLDAASRLLLLLSRPTLAPRQQDRVREYASAISDWEEFAQLASSKFVATLSWRHLSGCGAEVAPQAAMERMKAQARLATLATLRVAASQATFHRTCIDRTGAGHAYLKGVALAGLYANNIAERYCRDVDVLVPESGFAEVLRAATSAGYRVFIDDIPGQTIDSAADIQFLCKFADSVLLVGQDGIAIDMHRRLDRRHVNFDTNQALATAETFQLPGAVAKRLCPPMHFAYICYHHSRHFWSRLHWVADLNAFTATSADTRRRALEIADVAGLRTTVDAAIEFSELTGKPELWDDALSRGTGGGQFLLACLMNLGGDVEVELRKHRPSGDLMASWQIARTDRRRFMIRSWLRRLRPRPAQYLRSPLPPPLHWMYYLRNAVGVMSSAAKSALSPRS